MKILSLFFAIVAIILLSSSVCLFAHQEDESFSFSVNTATNRIIDQYGRARFFRGPNVVTKGFPFLPTPAVSGDWNPNSSFVEKDMETLQQLGLNSMRLMTSFTGTMPSPGVVNQTYLSELKKIVTKSQTYGIYTLLDAHQDVMSNQFCGEGFPMWWSKMATKNISAEYGFPWPLDKPYQTDSNGVPLPSECAKHAWAEGYFALTTASSFQAFYNNADGLQDYFIQFWQAVAEAFKEIPGKFIELLNEPFPGDVWAKKIKTNANGTKFIWGPELLIPQTADRVNLQHTWDNVAMGIRKADPNAVIFFEPITFDWIVGAGFDHAPGGREFANRSVLSFHFYKPPDFFPSSMFEGMTRDAKKMGTASFLSEFGVSSCPSCGNSIAPELMDLVDSTLQSGFLFWDFKPMQGARTGYGYSLWNADGSVNDDVRAAVSRTYAQAVAGVPLAQFFNKTTKVFTLSFKTDASITQNYRTDIYYNNQYHYPNGVDVQVAQNSPNSSIHIPVQYTDTHVYIQTPPSLLPAGTQVDVRVTPMSSSADKINHFKFFKKNSKN